MAMPPYWLIILPMEVLLAGAQFSLSMAVHWDLPSVPLTPFQASSIAVQGALQQTRSSLAVERNLIGTEYLLYGAGQHSAGICHGVGHCPFIIFSQFSLISVLCNAPCTAIE